MSDEFVVRPGGPLRGTLRVPGDKSISHRALICNALAPGEAQIYGLLDSADCRSTMTCLRQWGVEFDESDDRILVRSPGQDEFRPADGVLDCGNSGTSIRLLSGVAAGLPFRSGFDGDHSLRSRPMRRVLDPLEQMGVRVDSAATAPFWVDGGTESLRGFDGELPVASAQVKSCIVFAALRAGEPSRIVEPGPSRDHTERMLAAMGAQIEADSATIRIHPGAPLRPRDVEVPGDISAAAYWMIAAAMIPGSELNLPNVGVNPRRTGVIDALRQMGARIELGNLREASGEPVADLVVRGGPLHGVLLDDEMIVRAVDELPTLAVAAALAQGVTEIRDAAELRVKESDRIAATASMLRAMGVEVEERPDGMRVVGGQLQGATVDSHGDHRIAMSAAVAALASESESGPTTIRRADAVEISYPGFWRDLDRLRHVAV
ncbi:MAG: 3-phosphoshikimate 1-carboxyvinyltransferase [Chloroflexi bacterium]|nr:3-phosphoshikimate 1-carboxyvinyltransferase [Chloroflexota bacterium]MCY3697952.1 3-phosphoshikimate 1-carboxyvinyltransferase [Chloroflexota bacterium]MYB22209.1 3-phosphoshikimate 1-carboxyvinyltransferase [Chloroflexota bacterium]MYI03328.1 3-phosphoshikimate 1-carboxyvinyltransferase [Chloroflexota bacterium]